MDGHYKYQIGKNRENGQPATGRPRVAEQVCTYIGTALRGLQSVSVSVSAHWQTLANRSVRTLALALLQSAGSAVQF